MLTRAQRLEAAQAAWSDPDSGADGLAAALDAALADLGGLDGLTLLADLTDQSRPVEDRKATLVSTGYLNTLRADRDRLREALRVYVGVGPHSPAKREWDAMCAALHESEAGT